MFDPAALELALALALDVAELGTAAMLVVVEERTGVTTAVVG